MTDKDEQNAELQANQLIGRTQAKVQSADFDAQLATLVAKYGSGKNIPPHELEKLLPPIEEHAEAGMIFGVFTYYICNFLDLDKEESEMVNLARKLSQGKFESVDEVAIVDSLIQPIAGMKRRIYNKMIELGDIDQERINYLFAGNDRAKLDAFLDDESL